MDKNEGCKRRILLTFAGNTDPTRGQHDGPILHICRYYKPEKIYLILTEEMKLRDKKNNIYEEAIKENLKGYLPEIERVDTEIKDAHLFDGYFDILYNTFEKIKEKEKEAEILVNLTSGTAQMTSNLIMYIIDSTDINIKGLQVSTPEKKSNTEKVVGIEYDIVLEAESNFDNLENSENRIIEPDLKRYSRVLIKNQIQELLMQYKYTTCIQLLKRNVFNENKELDILLNFANDRKNLKGFENYKKEGDINRKLASLGHEKYNGLYYYKKDKKVFKVEKWYQIVDYFALANIEAKSGNISKYILMLEPLSVNIYLSILEDVLEINLDNLFDKIKKNKYDSYVIKTSKLDSELVEYIEKKGGIKGKLKDGNVSAAVLVSMIKYFLGKNGNRKMELSYIDNFSSLFFEIKDTRNDLAHALIQINKKDFEVESKIKIENINKEIREFFKKYYSTFGYKESMIYVYDKINRFVSEILEREK